MKMFGSNDYIIISIIPGDLDDYPALKTRSFPISAIVCTNEISLCFRANIFGYRQNKKLPCNLFNVYQTSVHGLVLAYEKVGENVVGH